MSRDEKVLSIRPNLELGAIDKTDMELFQNETVIPSTSENVTFILV